MRVFKTKSELQELALLENLNEPRLLILKSALKLCIDECNPDSSVEVIADDYPIVKSLIMIMWNKFAKPYVLFYLVNDGVLTDLDGLIEQVFDTLMTLGDEFVLFHTEIAISVYLKSTVLATKFDFSSPVLPLYAYYIPPERHEDVSKLQLQLPQGFQFVELNPEKDAPVISGAWPYAREGDVFNVQSKISYGPSVGVKFENNLAAFEIVYQAGFLNHLYTLPEFRGKGLAKVVELKLCQKLIDINICPLKYVGIENPVAVPMADSSPFWAKVPCGSEPGIFDYRYIRAK